MTKIESGLENMKSFCQETYSPFSIEEDLEGDNLLREPGSYMSGGSSMDFFSRRRRRIDRDLEKDELKGQIKKLKIAKWISIFAMIFFLGEAIALWSILSIIAVVSTVVVQYRKEKRLIYM